LLSQPVPVDIRRSALNIERNALLAAAPADRSWELDNARWRLQALQRRRADVEAGKVSGWADLELQAAANVAAQAGRQRALAERTVETGELGWRSRRFWRAELDIWQQREAAARAEYQRRARPALDDIDTEIAEVEGTIQTLRQSVAERCGWLRDHSDAAHRLDAIDRALDNLTASPAREVLELGFDSTPELRQLPQIDQGLDLGMDLGL
jgi:hypothetical protein